MDNLSRWITDQTVLGSIAVLTFLILVLDKVRELSRGLTRWIVMKLARLYWKVAGQTLVVIPFNQDAIWWHMSHSGKGPSMQVVGDFHFTNITAEPTLVVKTYLVAYYKQWKLLPCRTKVEGLVLVKHHQSDMHGQYYIMPRSTTIGRPLWFIHEPVRQIGESLQARACFVDRFGNEHWTEKLTWKYLP